MYLYVSAKLEGSSVLHKTAHKRPMKVEGRKGRGSARARVQQKGNPMTL